MAYNPYADGPDYYAEVQRRRGMVGNILKVHGIEPEVGRATPPALPGALSGSYSAGWNPRYKGIGSVTM